jgi:hypothetical protein
MGDKLAEAMIEGKTVDAGVLEKGSARKGFRPVAIRD